MLAWLCTELVANDQCFDFPNKIDCGTKSGTDGESDCQPVPGPGSGLWLRRLDGRTSCRVAHSFLHFSQHSVQAPQFHNDRQIVSLHTLTL